MHHSESTILYAAKKLSKMLSGTPTQEARDLFASLLTKKVMDAGLQTIREIELYCDWSPNFRVLTEALSEAGDLSLPSKTGVRVRPDGSIEWRSGHGDPWHPL